MLIKRWLVLLNGPPGCGKDTLANFMALKYGFAHVKMAAPLKSAFSSLFSLTPAFIESNKDSAKMVDGETIRQGLISLAEDWVKPRYGESIFGHLLHMHLQKNILSKFVIISDAGFTVEVSELCKHYEIGMPLILQITRPGHTFDNDSREYAFDRNNHAVHLSIANSGSTKDWLAVGSYAICRHINKQSPSDKPILPYDETLLRSM